MAPVPHLAPALSANWAPNCNQSAVHAEPDALCGPQRPQPTQPVMYRVNQQPLPRGREFVAALSAQSCFAIQL